MRYKFKVVVRATLLRRFDRTLEVFWARVLELEIWWVLFFRVCHENLMGCFGIRLCPTNGFIHSFVVLWGVRDHCKMLPLSRKVARDRICFSLATESSVWSLCIQRTFVKDFVLRVVAVFLTFKFWNGPLITVILGCLWTTDCFHCTTGYTLCRWWIHVYWRSRSASDVRLFISLMPSPTPKKEEWEGWRLLMYGSGWMTWADDTWLPI